MNSDGQKWHYLIVKNLSRLLRGITSSHEEDFYCLNCFHSYRTENKLEAHKNVKTMIIVMSKCLLKTIIL